MSDELTVTEREEYVKAYAQFLGCAANPFSIALKIIRGEQAFRRACVFMFQLDARDEEQMSYARRAGDYLKETLGESYNDPDLTEDWLYQFVSGYIESVDASYKW